MEETDREELPIECAHCGKHFMVRPPKVVVFETPGLFSVNVFQPDWKNGICPHCGTVHGPKLKVPPEEILCWGML